jgi:antitoxin (DNA-binding transcriptional repressor) of toxin-antitoxin stability system
MSTETVEQIGRDFGEWLAAVRRGETVAIMEAGREVARLVPPDAAGAGVAALPSSAVGADWPDFAARRRAVFGDAVLPAGNIAPLIDEERGA